MLEFFQLSLEVGSLQLLLEMLLPELLKPERELHFFLLRLLLFRYGALLLGLELS